MKLTVLLLAGAAIASTALPAYGQSVFPGLQAARQEDTAAVDLDGDGLTQQRELELARTFLPRMWFHGGEQCPQPGGNSTHSGSNPGRLVFRVRPHPNDSRLIAVVFVLLYARDCGGNGHFGDAEPITVTLEPNSSCPTGFSAYSATSRAHFPGSGQVTDTAYLVGQCSLDSTPVFVSKDKHGNYMHYSACQRAVGGLETCGTAFTMGDVNAWFGSNVGEEQGWLFGSLEFLGAFTGESLSQPFCGGNLPRGGCPALIENHLLLLTDGGLPALPGVPITISPSGSISTRSPEFVWEPIAGSTGYWLGVDRQDEGSFEFVEYHTQLISTSICSPTRCAFTPNLSLPNGYFRWTISTVSSGGVVRSSDPRYFSLSLSEATTCGNRICEFGESCGTCLQDCASPQSFSVTPPSGSPGQALVFAADMSAVTSGTQVLWDMGTGTHLSGSSVSYAFPSAGSFTVVMTSNDANCQSTQVSSQNVPIGSSTCADLAAQNGSGWTFECKSPMYPEDVLCDDGPSGQKYTTPDCPSPQFCCLYLTNPPPPPDTQSCGALGGEYCSGTSSCPAGYASLGTTRLNGAVECQTCCDLVDPCADPSTHNHSGSCGSSDSCGHVFGSASDCWWCGNGVCEGDESASGCADCRGDGHCELGVEDCGVSPSDCPCWMAGTTCNAWGWPGQCVDRCSDPAYHNHSGSCGQADECGHPIGTAQECLPSCGAMGGDYCSQSGGWCPGGYGYLGQSNDCESCCQLDPCESPYTHDHGGSCGSTDSCGHSFGAYEDCGCPGAPTVWDTCWDYRCDTGWSWVPEYCEACEQQCTTEWDCWTNCEWDYCWDECVPYESCWNNCYSYECGGYWAPYDYNCRWESYQCNPHQCGY